LEPEFWAPACGFASCFDAPLGLVGTYEAEGEAAKAGHVFGAMAGSTARQVVFELDNAWSSTTPGAWRDNVLLIVLEILRTATPARWRRG